MKFIILILSARKPTGRSEGLKTGGLMFKWLQRRQRTPKEEPAPQVQDVSKMQTAPQVPTPDSLPEMGFNVAYQHVQDQERGTRVYYRLESPLRPDQRERLVFLLDATRNFEYDLETHVLRVDMPQAVANL